MSNTADTHSGEEETPGSRSPQTRRCGQSGSDTGQLLAGEEEEDAAAIPTPLHPLLREEGENRSSSSESWTSAQSHDVCWNSLEDLLDTPPCDGPAPPPAGAGEEEFHRRESVGNGGAEESRGDVFSHQDGRDLLRPGISTYSRNPPAESVSGEEASRGSHVDFNTCSSPSARHVWSEGAGLMPLLLLASASDSSSEGSSEERYYTCPEPRPSSDESSSDHSGTTAAYHFSLLSGQRFAVCQSRRVACVTLDSGEPGDLAQDHTLSSLTDMPRKPAKTPSEGKAHSKHQEKPEQLTQPREADTPSDTPSDLPVTVIETIIVTEKKTPKAPGKKKKKHTPAKHTPAKLEGGSSPDTPTQKTEAREAKTPPHQKMDDAHPSKKAESSGKSVDKTELSRTLVGLESDALSKVAENQSRGSDTASKDDVKRRRITDAVPVRARPLLPAIFRQARADGAEVARRPYSEVVKQKTPPTEAPRPDAFAEACVVSEIQAEPVPADPQSVSLRCHFRHLPPDASVTWTKEGAVLTESPTGRTSDGQCSLTLLKAGSKDLGLYTCSSSHVSTADFHLTSEVLMELVIPSHDPEAQLRPADGDEENIQCRPLLFKEDFLSHQYFGERQPACIVTEKVHFGEGMHRKAFRTTLREGALPRLRPGHPCVLKVHNAITYGTRSLEELVQKNYSLAVEECHVQNTAREYIKAYHSAAQTAEAFGEVPEIIPIYLVHRPANHIPYATLEEELRGDFVKYSVRDGKEINLMRRDSEAGQKCCTFQHWVYVQTEGNLLITDMQGVGMKLTDVGIATCKKGYKGFRGNCATSFIDQFKALHQCNRYCDLLGLSSVQPKKVARSVGKTPSAPKKKSLGVRLNQS